MTTILEFCLSCFTGNYVCRTSLMLSRKKILVFNELRVLEQNYLLDFLFSLFDANIRRKSQ